LPPSLGPSLKKWISVSSQKN